MITERIRRAVATILFVSLSSATPVGSLSAADRMEGSQRISAEFPYKKRHVQVLGQRMAYVDEGSGPVVLFLHGNPTSSYLWRNILPYVPDSYRAIAPDLIGMGDSGKPRSSYRFLDHARYLDAFIAALDLQDITLVVHDWGSALGMRYARLNPGKIRALAFMEAIVPPALPVDSYAAMGPLTGEMFRALRTPGLGEALVLQHNFFVETVLGRMGAGRALSDAEMAQYRAPFRSSGDRIPTLVWPREIPIAGEPADVAAQIAANGEWLYSSDIPKLYFHAQPGALLPPPAAAYVIANAKNLTAVDLGSGSHFLQESSPHAIGRALSRWLQSLD